MYLGGILMFLGALLLLGSLYGILAGLCPDRSSHGQDRRRREDAGAGAGKDTMSTKRRFVTGLFPLLW